MLMLGLACSVIVTLVLIIVTAVMRRKNRFVDEKIFANIRHLNLSIFIPTIQQARTRDSDHIAGLAHHPDQRQPQHLDQTSSSISSSAEVQREPGRDGEVLLPPLVHQLEHQLVHQLEHQLVQQPEHESVHQLVAELVHRALEFRQSKKHLLDGEEARDLVEVETFGRL